MRLAVNPALLEWRGPKQRQTDRCSVKGCGYHFTEDDVPLRMWRDDGSAIALCDRCMEAYVRPE